MKAPVTILVLSLLHAATATEFHVALSGADSNPGTKEKPFATLGRAAAALAARTNAQRAGAVDVVLHAGTYQLQDSINLGTAQSGTEAAPVTWRAAGDDGRGDGGALSRGC